MWRAFAPMPPLTAVYDEGLAMKSVGGRQAGIGDNAKNKFHFLWRWRWACAGSHRFDLDKFRPRRAYDAFDRNGR
jgi:hypothetical protein